MFIGFIMAGDGEVDQCIGPYDTYEEAETAIEKINADHYNADGDRAYVVSPQTYAEALAEIEEGKAEDAEYEARYEMSANAVDGLDDGMGN